MADINIRQDGLVNKEHLACSPKALLRPYACHCSPSNLIYYYYNAYARTSRLTLPKQATTDRRHHSPKTRIFRKLPPQRMTTYATRSPLALLTNPHMMNDARKTGRRTSDRLREKEDLPIPNVRGGGTTKASEKGVTSEKPTKANASETSGTSRKPREKRKLGMW